MGLFKTALMPLTRIVCPHCEQSAEVMVTSVTRSRECLHCGKTILLQTAARDSRRPVKAVLMPVAGAKGNGAGPEEAAGTNPQVLTGDPWDRMALDPEVLRTAARFKWGVTFFASLLLLAVFWDKLFLWSGISNEPVHAMRGSPDSALGKPEAAVLATSAQVANPNAGRRAQTDAPGNPDPPAGPRERGQRLALKSAMAFLDAATVEERLARVRDRELIEGRMRSYYEREGDRPVVYERVEALEVNPAGPFTYSFNVIFPDGTRRKIMMGRAPTGEYLADWGSFVVYSEMSWEEFRAKRPQTSTLFRVLADRQELFNSEFTDAETYLCLRLLNPLDPGAMPIYGYASRNSSIGRTLKFVMEKGEQEPFPLMLKLCYPEHRETGRQVWITEFIGEGWIARNW